MCIDLATTHPTTATRIATTSTRPRKPRRKQRAREASPPPPPPLPTFARNVDALLREFEDGTLPRADWTHAAHLVVALAYAHRHPVEAYERLREGIRRYNQATGTPETPTRGYHETITRAWFHLVLHFLDVFDDGRPLPDLVDDLVVLYGRDELFVHYSRERLLSPEARARWVAPDLRPLPALQPFTNQDRRWLATLTPRVDGDVDVDERRVTATPLAEVLAGRA